MNPIQPQIRPAAKFPGGKYYLAGKIVSTFPPHETYAEVSAGMFSVLLAKPRSEIEIINDLDWFNWNLYVTLRDNGNEFRDMVRALEYTDRTFQFSAIRHFKAKATYNLDDPIDWSKANPPDKPVFLDAVDYYVYRRMSRGGRGCRNPWTDSCRKSFAWSKRRLRGGLPGDQNAWRTANEINLPKITERLQGVQCWNKNADEFYFQLANDPSALIYDDPTYLHETRSTARMYGSMEMTTPAHVKRLQLANEAKCMVCISGYDNNLYRALLGNGRTIIPDSGRENLFGREPWRCRRWELPNNQSEEKKKARRIECIWFNYESDLPEELDDPMYEGAEDAAEAAEDYA